MSRPSGSSTRDAERFVLDAVRRLVRLLREASRLSEQRFGLSAAQLFVLHQLAGDEALSINELAARTLTHQSSVSVVVSRLLASRLVARAGGSGDARRVEIRLTPRGRRLLGRAPTAEQARLVDGLRALSSPDRRALCRGLGAWLDALGLTEGEATMFFEDEAVRRPARRPRAAGGKKERRRA